MAATDRLWLSDRQVDLVTGDVVRAGRADLLTDVWGHAPTARTRAVDFTVRRLRQKIEPASSGVRTPPSRRSGRPSGWRDVRLALRLLTALEAS